MLHGYALNGVFRTFFGIFNQENINIFRAVMQTYVYVAALLFYRAKKKSTADPHGFAVLFNYKMQ